VAIDVGVETRVEGIDVGVDVGGITSVTICVARDTVGLGEDTVGFCAPTNKHPNVMINNPNRRMVVRAHFLEVFAMEISFTQ